MSAYSDQLAAQLEGLTPTGWFAQRPDGETTRTVARWYWPESSVCEVWVDGAWMAAMKLLDLTEDPDWVSVEQSVVDAWTRESPE